MVCNSSNDSSRTRSRSRSRLTTEKARVCSPSHNTGKLTRQDSPLQSMEAEAGHYPGEREIRAGHPTHCEQYQLGTLSGSACLGGDCMERGDTKEGHLQQRNLPTENNHPKGSAKHTSLHQTLAAAKGIQGEIQAHAETS